MAMRLNLSVHRQWEDWASMALGFFVVISPWVTRTTEPQAAVLNAVIVGLLVLAIGTIEMQVIRRWEEWCEFLLGAWLAISPWALGYSHQGAATTLHVVLGAVIAALALLELWQDRDVATPAG